MSYLALVSLIWAFSFGLTSKLSGIDSFLVAAIRLCIASILFAPFLRMQAVPKGQHLKLIGCGAVQFGLMYICYIKAYAYLPSHLVALFSVLTPVYVVLIHDLRQRVWTSRYLLAAVISVIGAAIIKAKGGNSDTLWQGFALMQLAGISFAFGQVYYRDWKRQHESVEDHKVFGLLYLGGAGLALIFCSFATDWATIEISTKQWSVLLYLGIIASGLGFFLWNKGATLTSSGTLAAFNNMVVPLAMFASLFVFGEIGDASPEHILRLVAGGTLIFSAVFIAERKSRAKSSTLG